MIFLGRYTLTLQYYQFYQIIFDNYFSDNYTTDWHMNDNTERPWVKFFFSHITEHLNNIVKSLGYNKAAIKALWYQQYLVRK